MYGKDSRAVTSGLLVSWLGEPRKQRSCIAITAIISPVSHLARYCIPPEVKFDVFMCLKCREENLIRNFFLIFLIKNNIKT